MSGTALLPRASKTCALAAAGLIALAAVARGELGAIIEQRPIPALARARELLINRRIQVDHEAARTQVIPVLRFDDGPAAGRKNDTVFLRQLIDDSCLAFAKPFLAFLFEDEGDVDAGARLYLVVAVHEVEMQQSRELSADGRFACAHRADKKDVFAFGHV